MISILGAPVWEPVRNFKRGSTNTPKTVQLAPLPATNLGASMVMLSSTAAASSTTPHRFTCLHQERLRRRFRFCATISGAVSLATTASNSAPLSMAFEDRILSHL
jgi:hypothetical protein